MNQFQCRRDVISSMNRRDDHTSKSSASSAGFYSRIFKSFKGLVILTLGWVIGTNNICMALNIVKKNVLPSPSTLFFKLYNFPLGSTGDRDPSWGPRVLPEVCYKILSSRTDEG